MVELVEMSEIAELFTELLFGSGAWFGLILIFAIAVLVCYKVKEATIVFMIVLIFLSLEYLQHMADSSMHVWYFLISLVEVCVLGAIFFKGLKK